MGNSHCRNHQQIPAIRNHLCEECNLVSLGLFVCRMQSPKGLFINPHTKIERFGIIVSCGRLKEIMIDHAIANCQPTSSFKLDDLKTERGLLPIDDNQVLLPGIYLASYSECMCTN